MAEQEKSPPLQAVTGIGFTPSASSPARDVKDCVDALKGAATKAGPDMPINMQCLNDAGQMVATGQCTPDREGLWFRGECTVETTRAPLSPEPFGQRMPAHTGEHYKFHRSAPGTPGGAVGSDTAPSLPHGQVPYTAEVGIGPFTHAQTPARTVEECKQALADFAATKPPKISVDMQCVTNDDSKKLVALGHCAEGPQGATCAVQTFSQPIPQGAQAQNPGRKTSASQTFPRPETRGPG